MRPSLCSIVSASLRSFFSSALPCLSLSPRPPLGHRFVRCQLPSKDGRSQHVRHCRLCGHLQQASGITKLPPSLLLVLTLSFLFDARFRCPTLACFSRLARPALRRKRPPLACPIAPSASPQRVRRRRLLCLPCALLMVVLSQSLVSSCRHHRPWHDQLFAAHWRRQGPSRYTALPCSTKLARSRCLTPVLSLSCVGNPSDASIDVNNTIVLTERPCDAPLVKRGLACCNALCASCEIGHGVGNATCDTCVSGYELFDGAGTVCGEPALLSALILCSG
jgi:hypothetical protein